MPVDVYRARLDRLIEVLDTDAREHRRHFNMATFSRPFEYGPDTRLHAVEQDRRDRHAEGVPPWECGTVACVAGWVPYATGIANPDRDGWSDHALRVLTGWDTVDIGDVVIVGDSLAGDLYRLFYEAHLDLDEVIDELRAIRDHWYQPVDWPEGVA